MTNIYKTVNRYAMILQEALLSEGLTIACRTTLLVSCQDRVELCLPWSLSSSAIKRLCFSASVNKCKQNDKIRQILWECNLRLYNNN